MLSYLTSLFYNPLLSTSVVTPIKEQKPVFLITSSDLLKVNLTPVANIIPNPARNMPPNFAKVDLRNLNKAQLDIILSTKLRPTTINKKPIYYPPRHPVLKELHQRFELYAL
jgi:hypothetical protein